MSPEPPAPVVVDVQAEPAYVLAFPVYVALTIGASPPSAALNGLPLPRTHRLSGAIGLRLWKDGEAEPFVHIAPSAIVDEDLGHVGFRLRPGEQRRFLLELSPLLPQDLQPGHYAAQLSYGERERPTDSARFAMVFRPPNPAEQAELDALAEARSQAGSWGEWAEQPVTDRAALQPPSSAADPLRYPRALRFMLHGEGGLGNVDDSFLDLLDGVFAADAAGFRAEILAARDGARFAAHAQQVKANHPGLEAWMDAVASGTTPIVWARTQRDS